MTPSTRELRVLLKLSAKREVLLGEIAELDEHIRRAWNAGGLSRELAGPKKRYERGAMKKLVLGALEEAGPAGMAAKDLAVKLKVRPLHLHAWLNMTGKRNGLVEAVTRGVYRLASPPSKTEKKTAPRVRPSKKLRRAGKTKGKK